ncbi:MAG: hypothetical protein OEZ01_04015 [Candidatus Heimdallarchaeota archaeon]|nr:hypothetical protein [Candidatus Heimdallarchaeota archaeon]MDH5645145.1 hypothetical protein [Candidatus Heimdallarchaeota archaeon]
MSKINDLENEEGIWLSVREKEEIEEKLKSIADFQQYAIIFIMIGLIMVFLHIFADLFLHIF